jgi:hypothetical protein
MIMAIRTTIRVGLHTTANGKTLSRYRFDTTDMESIQTEEGALEYIRRRISSVVTFNRNALLACIDNGDYSVTNEVTA